MDDDDFLKAFRRCDLTEFHHRDHLRLTWLTVTRWGGDAAPNMIRDGIQGFARHHGQSAKYHDTITRFWVALIRHMVEQRSSGDSFDSFLAAFPMLLDKSLPLRHWTRDTLFSDAARAGWVPPDVAPMPE
jgi:hypothetical protein